VCQVESIDTTPTENAMGYYTLCAHGGSPQGPIGIARVPVVGLIHGALGGVKPLTAMVELPVTAWPEQVISTRSKELIWMH